MFDAIGDILQPLMHVLILLHANLLLMRMMIPRLEFDVLLLLCSHQIMIARGIIIYNFSLELLVPTVVAFNVAYRRFGAKEAMTGHLAKVLRLVVLLGEQTVPSRRILGIPSGALGADGCHWRHPVDGGPLNRQIPLRSLVTRIIIQATLTLCRAQKVV